MIRSIQECRDESEIINFFKLRGKNLSIDDVYNLKTSYNNSKTKLNDKSKLTLNQLDKVAGGFYIIKQQKIFEKNKPETVYSLMLGNVPFEVYKNILGINRFKGDYIEKFGDPNFIPLIDKTHKSEETDKFGTTISLIPIKHLSMRTLRIELLQGILNTPVKDIYSAKQQGILQGLLINLTDGYVKSLGTTFNSQTYMKIIFTLCNKEQPSTQKQVLRELFSFYAKLRLRA